jgi:hypothetical protein
MVVATLPGVIRWGQLPVPYVAAWSSETAVRIAPDPLLGKRPALFRDGRRGAGRPLFGRMDEARTRAVVCRRLCQVCAQPLREAGYVVDVPYGTSNGHPLVHEPPTCRRCFEVSVALCPGIARMASKPRVLVARVRRYEAVAVIIGPADEASGGDAQLNAALAAWKGAPPIGYVRPALVDYELIELPRAVA